MDAVISDSQADEQRTYDGMEADRSMSRSDRYKSKTGVCRAAHNTERSRVTSAG